MMKPTMVLRAFKVDLPEIRKAAPLRTRILMNLFSVVVYLVGVCLLYAVAWLSTSGSREGTAELTLLFEVIVASGFLFVAYCERGVELLLKGKKKLDGG